LIATAVFFTTALITANFANGGSNIPSCGSVPCYTPIYPSSTEVVFMAGAVLLSSITNFILVPKVLKPSKESRTLFSYLAGVEFGLGLLISGMADSAKVLRFFAFLTDPSRFDPSLALIMLFGIGPSLTAYLMQSPGQGTETEKTGTKPTLAEQWRLPTATVADIDLRFVAGAVAFGVAWGLRGVCPGPAVLRSVLQPTWGLATMTGYTVGNLV